MNISLVFNLKRSNDVSQAEFDSQETIDFVRANIEKLGHRVSLVEDDNSSLQEFIQTLMDSKPDMIFNMAEGFSGRNREGFYPALFERLGIPYTGSDCTALGITSNKNLTDKFIFNILQSEGCAYAPSAFIDSSFLDKDIRKICDSVYYFPAIVKPNFEGSSKGITKESIVDSSEELLTLVLKHLKDFPEGIIIQRFMLGTEISVPWIEGIGVLEPASYHFESKDKYAIYDFSLKRTGQNLVTAKVPADLPELTRKDLQRVTQKVVKALNLKGLARLDFRVDLHPSLPKGHGIFFIEANALPSLASGDDAEMYKALALMGKEPTEMFDAIIRSALKETK